MLILLVTHFLNGEKMSEETLIDVTYEIHSINYDESIGKEKITTVDGQVIYMPSSKRIQLGINGPGVLAYLADGDEKFTPN